MALPSPSVGELVYEGAVEPLDLPVGLGSKRSGPDVRGVGARRQYT